MNRKFKLPWKLFAHAVCLFLRRVDSPLSIEKWIEVTNINRTNLCAFERRKIEQRVERVGSLGDARETFGGIFKNKTGKIEKGIEKRFKNKLIIYEIPRRKRNLSLTKEEIGDFKFAFIINALLWKSLDSL